MRGAAAVVVVVVAADGCGLEVDEAAREGPGSGFSTVIRWVSSVPSRFQGGYCHESGVECMFPAARQSAFERLRAQVRRIVLFVRGALWLQVAVHVGPGQTHASSRLSDKATAAGSIPYTPQCACGTARSGQRPAAHGWASGIGQYRDRTVHMGRCRQDVSNVSILFFPFLLRACCFAGLSLDWMGSGFPSQGTHGTRFEAGRTEAAGQCESSGQRWQRRGEGRRDKAKHRR